MILDWKNDPDFADRHDILDAGTGKPHPNMQIFYADDALGLIRFHKLDPDGTNGAILIEDDEPAWAEERCDIKIVEKVTS